MSSDGITIENGNIAESVAPETGEYRGQTELVLPELGEEQVPEAEPEEPQDEVPVEPEDKAPVEEDERLQRIIAELAKQGKKSEMPAPQYEPHPALRKDYLKQKYGEALGEDNFDALVEMANEIAYAHQEYYHKTEVQPYMARLMKSHETNQIDAAITELNEEYKDVESYRSVIKQIIKNDPDMNGMPPEKRVRYAYLEAVSTKLPEVIKKAEQHGRNNQLKEMKQAFRTPAASPGRSAARETVNTVSPEAMRVFRAMGVDPIKASKQPSKFSKGGK